VSDLTDILRHLLAQFGRPPETPELRATDQNVETIDQRLTEVESVQQEVEARLHRLEIQSWRE
jgi:hypothetical protein